MSSVQKKIKILTTYTGKKYKNIREILNDATAKNILWLEILVNDSINWEVYLNNPIIRKNYFKASKWYNNFKTLLEICKINRKPLKTVTGKVDMRDYRKFLEVLYYVS